jgi:hypothetical protein
VLDTLYKILDHALVNDAVIRTHNALARTLDTSILIIGKQIAACVRIALLRGASVFTNESMSAVIESTLEDLSKCCSPAKPLSATALLFAMPLLKLVIEASSDTTALRAGLNFAFKVIADAAQATVSAKPAAAEAEPIPKELLASLLLSLLESVNSLYSAAQPAFLALISTLATDELGVILEKCCMSTSADVRWASLEGLSRVRGLQGASIASLQLRVWQLRYDDDSKVSERAAALWESLALTLPNDYSPLLSFLSHENESVRSATGKSISAAAATLPETSSSTILALIHLYKENADVVIEESLSTRQERQVISKWKARSGVALCLGACVDRIDSRDTLVKCFEFLIDVGLADTNDRVWGEILASGLKLIDVHGQTYLSILLPIFEHTFERLSSHSMGIDDDICDRIREGVVVFLGTIARHMDADKDSEKVLKVVSHLVEVLKTPSHSVQKAASDCLSPLIPMIVDEDARKKVVDTMIARLSNGVSYGERKGAALGLAGIVVGLKLSCLKKYNILDTLEEFVKDKNNTKARQGALFAYESLFRELGNKFEPYIDSILPHLLTSFSDPNTDVREATQEASQTVMANLTAYGVQRALPRVVSGLEDKAWRTKLEAIGLLGSMAYCAPKQLSSCLPTIVPRLLDVMADPHQKVQDETKKSLKVIGSVIRNPEIRSLVPTLLLALDDPAGNTKTALVSLMRTSFIHSVDPPSLALIIPILRRGLKDRVPSTKIMAAQITGSMCSLITDVKDIMPYVNTLSKYLKQIIVDQIPDVRSVGSRALSALFQGVGEENFPDLLEYLLDILKRENSSVERSGAAQSLSQIMKSIG